MQCAFGQVIDQKMHYSPVGQIVAEEWTNAEILRSNITLDQWIVMPNHVRGIIQIKNVETSRRDVSTGLRPNSIGSIIGQFKSVCAKRIWAAGYRCFRWQRNYHDHIIRGDRSLHRIREYIQNNPLKWDLDAYHPHNRKEHNGDNKNNSS